MDANINAYVYKTKFKAYFFTQKRKVFFNSMVSTRIQNIIDAFCDSNKSLFAQKIGVRPSVIGNITGLRQGNPSFEVLQKIKNAFAEIDVNWLLTGEGKMLVEGQKKRIEPSDKVAVPIVDISVAAGMGIYNQEYIEVEDELTIPSYLIKHNQEHLGVRVKGPSMSPTIQDSTYLIIRLLDRSEWQDMPNNHVYVIGDMDGKGYVKRVRNRLSRGFVVCTSDNIDKNSFPNFNLHLDEINTIWHAEWYLSARMDNINENYYSELNDLKNRIEDLEDIMGQKTLEKYINPT